MLFIFGMSVKGNDGGDAGKLDRVLLDADSREVTHVVLHSPRVSEDLLIPLNMIQGSTDHELLLQMAAGSLEEMPRYYEGRRHDRPAGRVDTASSVVHEPSERRQQLEDALNVPDNAIELAGETRVTLPRGGGQPGRLHGLGAEQYTNRLSMVVVGAAGGRTLSVPDGYIGELRPGAIVLTATREQLEQFPDLPVGNYVTLRGGSQATGA